MSSFIRIFLLLVISSVVSKAQSFEGKILYQNSYKCKIPNVTDELFTAMMGASWEYTIKGASYRTASNGTMLQWQLYLPKDNKLYSKFSNSPSIFWNDGAVNPDSVLKTELNKDVVEILGHRCDELILTCKSGVQKYYFNSKFKVDPNLYKNHKFGNWHEYLIASKSVPLKITIDNAQFSLESVATGIQEQKVNDQLFVLPAGVALEKSPF
jgi:hypothetical protein